MSDVLVREASRHYSLGTSAKGFTMTNSPPNARPSLTVTAVWLGLLTILIAAFWYIVLVYVPTQKKTFDEFGLLLPWMSKTAIDISMLLHDGRWVAIPVMLIVILGGVVILRHGLDAAKGGIVYALLMALILTASIGFFIASIQIPLRKLLEGLSR
jgi:hypothetical protein